MFRLIALAAGLIAALAIGIWVGRSTSPMPSQAAAGEDAREILYWVAPMDPNFRRDAPGKSPMGMDLVPVYADEAPADPGTVSFDPAIVNKLGVRVARATRSSLPRIIDTVGYVGYDEATVQHVHTRVDGWIEDLAVTASGDPIRAGDLMFTLYSPALVNAQEEYLAALRTGNAALSRASTARLAALGLSDPTIERIARERQVIERVPFRAGRDGVVSALGVREGMFVTPALEIMSIAGLDTMWVHAEVFERQSSWVEAGQRAEVTLDYRPGTTLSGFVDYVYPELDPETRTLNVRLRFDNASGLLKPNMFAGVRIDGRETGPIVNIPREAVIRDGETSRVVVDLGNGRFQSREVLVGIESGERVAIRRGLDAGESIVLSGQFLIDSESNTASALDRLAPPSHDHQHGGQP